MHIPGFGQFSRVLGLLSSQGLQKPLSTGKSLDITKEIPGGTPFRFCPESRDSDLFQISSIVVDQLPVHIDDEFFVHFEGEFLDTFRPNATFNMTVDCGSYCHVYNPTNPDERKGVSWMQDFCRWHPLEQPLGHHGNDECPPQRGPAMIHSFGYAWPWITWSAGMYNFTFDAKTNDGRRIYCITAEVCLRWRYDWQNKRPGTGPLANCSWPSEPNL